ncbi:hypothetical protein DQ353_06520 [Arthrobacter sp. AQ5-05]|nr:hypothetical protein DQ353_06520 [Arthrobacter sp. AQ5-05]
MISGSPATARSSRFRVDAAPGKPRPQCPVVADQHDGAGEGIQGPLEVIGRRGGQMVGRVIEQQQVRGPATGNGPG